MPAVTKAPGKAPASDAVRDEWRNRIAAEYGSAAITQHLTLWLIQVGASPELIDDGLRIVKDELEHARLSHEVYAAAGGAEPPALDRANLALYRRGDQPLELDLLRAAIQIFALGETVAVPLFKHLRAGTTVPTARVALDRILRDEVRHRDFGWTLLDWFLTTPLAPDVPALVAADLPMMFAGLERNYGQADFGAGKGVVPAAARAEPPPFAPADRAWGLAPPHEYAGILERTFERDYLPRFRARGIDPTVAWAQRRPDAGA